MHYLNLCEDFEGSGQTQWVWDDSFLQPSEVFSSSILKQFPHQQVHLMGPSTQNIDYDVVLLNHPVSSILSCLSSHLRGPYFFVFSSTFCLQIVHPWTAHFYHNDLFLLEINESCIHSALWQVFVFSEYWYTPVCLCLCGLIQLLWIHTWIPWRYWIWQSQVSKHFKEQHPIVP